MKLILSVILISIFSGLAIVHFYWASGGQFGFTTTLPANEQGVVILNPTPIDSILVGIGLSLFGLFYFFVLKSYKNKFLIFVKNVGLWVIPTIFTLRALGDFKYVGFFKQIKSTEFANLDTIFYSPLCMLVALIGFSIIKIKNTHN
ncbi:DUF3995 domain-containing protein [Cellulophaga sp. HaHaR_3_176]|uniref:DUF3995 domain-containing protein n=1 Tax=Cellulophaga sp. HaHaR_3_176 TaxID=1942464 RepID=UPI001C1FC52A|nr:DUF3995 domain-containing protein [Cellulophaga sp. HaHaR_3_176]QWX82531.1 DUF3995 domain-containing protein [Cellulophaga sp. HaHaR_3_176]